MPEEIKLTREDVEVVICAMFNGMERYEREHHLNGMHIDGDICTTLACEELGLCQKSL